MICETLRVQRDGPIGHRMDRQTIGRSDIKPLVHPREAQQRMHPQPEARRDPPDHRHARCRARRHPVTMAVRRASVV